MEWVLFLVINITLIEFGFNRKIKTTINIMGKTKQEKRILSAQETKLLLDSSKGGMMCPIFVVALGTGMRIGEILGLTWDCVDFENLVFTSKTNNPLNASNIKDSINYIVAKINRENPDFYFEHLTPHGLRHTFATNCIERGMTPKTLQKIMGHSSLQMTMDLYCHVREDTLKEEMEKVAFQID